MVEAVRTPRGSKAVSGTESSLRQTPDCRALKVCKQTSAGRAGGGFLPQYHGWRISICSAMEV